MPKVAFFDIEGTIRKSKAGKDYPWDYQDIEIREGIKERLWYLIKAGYYVIGVSNQGFPIVSGFYTIEKCRDMMDHTNRQLDYAFNDIFICPFLSLDNPIIPTLQYRDRKFISDSTYIMPNIGMALEAIEKYQIDELETSFMVGSNEIGKQFAKNLNIKYFDIDDFLTIGKSLKKSTSKNKREKSVYDSPEFLKDQDKFLEYWKKKFEYQQKNFPIWILDRLFTSKRRPKEQLGKMYQTILKNRLEHYKNVENQKEIKNNYKGLAIFEIECLKDKSILKKLEDLKREKYYLLAVSNQGDNILVKKEYNQKEYNQAVKILNYNFNNVFNDVLYSTSLDNNDEYKLPNIGMIIKAMKDSNVFNLFNSFVVGEGIYKELADNIGANYFTMKEFKEIGNEL